MSNASQTTYDSFLEAQSSMEYAARQFADEEVTRYREGLADYLGDVDEGREGLYEAMLEYTDNLQVVTYTNRAKALVTGFGYGAVLAEHEAEYGVEGGTPGYEALAFFILAREGYGVADEIAAGR